MSVFFTSFVPVPVASTFVSGFATRAEEEAGSPGRAALNIRDISHVIG